MPVHVECAKAKSIILSEFYLDALILRGFRFPGHVLALWEEGRNSGKATEMSSVRVAYKLLPSSYCLYYYRK